MKRLLPISILFSIAGIIFIYFRAPFYLLILLFGLLLVVPLFFSFNNMSQSATLMFIFLCVVFRMSQLNTQQMELQPFYDTEHTYEAVVIDEVQIDNGRGRSTLQLLNGEEQPLKGKVIFHVYDVSRPQLIQPGQVIRFKGTLRELSPKRNPGGFNEKLHYTTKGVYGRLTLSENSIEPVGYRERWTFKFLHFRRLLVHQLTTLTERQPVRDLVSTLLLGEKLHDTTIEEGFRTVGISHILAISGMHVGFLSMALLKLFERLKIPDKIARILSVIGLFFYAMLVAFPVSVVRAVLMLGIYQAGVVLKQVKDAFSALLATTAIVLMVYPVQLFSLSFQLSFMATLGIILFYQPLRYRLERRTGRTSFIGDSILLTLSANATTLPIVLFYFHRFNLLSFIGNILVVPLVGFVFIYTVVLLPLSFVFQGMTIFLFQFVQWTVQFILWITKTLGSIDGFTFRGVGLPLALILLLAIFIFYAAGYYRPKKKGKVAVCVLLLLVALIDAKTLPLTEQPLKIYFLDIGQGDATLLRTPKGYTYLIDGGGYQQEILDLKKIQPQPVSQSVLLPALYATGADRIDAAIITHNHEDHSQGVEELLTMFPVGRLYLSTKNNHPVLGQMACIDVRYLAAGQALKTPDGVVIECLWPTLPVEALDDTLQNHHAMVLRLGYGNHRLLMMSDSDVQTETALADNLGDVAILRVGHHGSKTSTGEELLHKTNPEAAVISVGRSNPYRLPDEMVTDRLKTQGVQTYRTDEKGCILVEMYGDYYRIKPYIQ